MAVVQLYMDMLIMQALVSESSVSTNLLVTSFSLDSKPSGLYKITMYTIQSIIVTADMCDR